MVKRIAIASVFVAVLAVAGLGVTSSANADHCHHRGGGYYAGYASYPVYGPSVAIAYPAPVYSAYYAPARVRPIRPIRAYAAPVPVPVYPASTSFRLSIGF
jgi:hypothetical protein